MQTHFKTMKRLNNLSLNFVGRVASPMVLNV
ncbi:MAG: hypothetical protein ACI80P_000924, partial [Flavobacteriales bacterium]